MRNVGWNFQDHLKDKVYEMCRERHPKFDTYPHAEREGLVEEAVKEFFDFLWSKFNTPVP